jgi:hypothetical protein
MDRHTHWIVLALLCLPLVASGDETKATASALSTIFCPERVPANKTMGLMQRSFLDLMDESRAKLQIALVIDGTESMASSISDIQSTLDQMLDDIELHQRIDVEYQLVVYRDAGAASGEVSFPLKQAGREFTADRGLLQQAINSIQVESGAPYFPEVVDAGLQQAITELAWDSSEEATRWILLFGDAPPFELGFEEAETRAKRRFATRQLAAMAAVRKIRVNCVLCNSREAERESFEAVLSETREFMNTLATESGGLMLDLSFPEIREAIESAAQKPRTKRIEIGEISREDIREQQLLAQQQQAFTARNRRVRMAVVPHASLDKMTFRSSLDEVQVATELRRRLRNLDGVEVKSSGPVQRQVELLKTRGITSAQLPLVLAGALDVDYVVWGSLTRKAGLLTVDSKIFSGTNGLEVGSAEANAEDVSAAASKLSAGLVNNALRVNSDQQLVGVFGRLRGNQRVIDDLLTPVSSRPETARLINQGYELLEQSLSQEAGNEGGATLVQNARLVLEQAVGPGGDPENPVAQFLLASCYFNQWLHAKQQADEVTATELRSLFTTALDRARGFRKNTIDEDLKTEIAADYALFRERDLPAAIALYEKLTGAAREGEAAIELHSALRAHWMLAGIYSGDWSITGENIPDGDKLRYHLLMILSHWPDSSEATFVRENIRWNEQAGKSALGYYHTQVGATGGN